MIEWRILLRGKSVLLEEERITGLVEIGKRPVNVPARTEVT